MGNSVKLTLSQESFVDFKMQLLECREAHGWNYPFIKTLYRS
jgi:hypothetical protein